MPASLVQHPSSLPQDDSGFTWDEVRYFSLAHYFYYQKALYLGDYRIAEKILKARENEKVKSLAAQISDNGNDKAWHRVYPRVLQEGLKTKFLQNLRLREWLSKQSAENMGSVQSLWGLTTDELVTGENRLDDANITPLGEALVEVRSQLVTP